MKDDSNVSTLPIVDSCSLVVVGPLDGDDDNDGCGGKEDDDDGNDRLILTSPVTGSIEKADVPCTKKMTAARRDIHIDTDDGDDSDRTGLPFGMTVTVPVILVENS